jgi:CheY-like chemotaxis protein
MQILLIDSSLVLSDFMKQEIAELSRSVVAIHNEEESWEIFNQLKIDLVIAGMQLKHEDGLTYLKRVEEFFQKSKRGKMPLFVFVTADDPKLWEDERKRQHILGILSRNFKPGEFRATLVAKINAILKTREDQILIVDDSDLNRKLLVKVLQRMGIHTLEANDGSQALLKLEEAKGQISAVISDNYMRIMNGIELFEKMKAVHDYSHIPFLMVTGENDPSQEKEWRNRGIKYFLTKPFTSEQLLFELSKSLLFYD